MATSSSYYEIAVTDNYENTKLTLKIENPDTSKVDTAAAYIHQALYPLMNSGKWYAQRNTSAIDPLAKLASIEYVKVEVTSLYTP